MLAGLATVVLLASGLVLGGGDTVAQADPLEGGVSPDDSRADYASWHRYPGAIVDSANPTGHLTVNPGRIWTDKTVFEDDEAAGTDVDHDLNIADDEMAVVLSALGTTRQVTSTRKPVIDLVIVVDNSYSMTQCVGSQAFCNETETYQNSRSFAMVRGVNAAVKHILEADPDARIGVVAFGTSTTELMPLRTPTVVPGTSDYLVMSAPSGNPSRMTIRSATSTIQAGYINNSLQYTNIQRGVSAGLSILAGQQTSTVAGNVQHIPSLILFSDGEPTLSARDASWWNLTGTTNQGPQSTGDPQYYGNGFLAALSAAYLKNRVADVYNDEAYNAAHGFTPVEANIYTVGLGMPGLVGEGQQLAYATLDPRGTLPPQGGTASNPMATSFGTAMNQYVTSANGQTTVSVNRSGSTYVTYTVNRPSGTLPGTTINAVDYNPTYEQLRYNTTFDAPNTAAELVVVFERIAQQVLTEEPVLPVETTSPDPNTDGYVTFTDPLGPFMRVSEMNSIVFCSILEEHDPIEQCTPTEFFADVPSTDGNVTTYTFDGTYKANDIFDSTPLSNIIITVEKGASLAIGDTVTVRIPVALLPMINSAVLEDATGVPLSMEWWESHPVHVYYKVAPKEGVAAALANPTTLPPADRQALLSYVAANTAEDGTLRFYANAFDTAADGTRTSQASAAFRPSSRNDFYRFGRDSILYTVAGDPTSTITQAQWDDMPGTTPVYRTVDQYTVAGEQGTAPDKTAIYLPTTKATLLAGAAPGASVVAIGGIMVAQAGIYNLSARVNNLDMPKCSDGDVLWTAGTLSCAVVNPESNRTETDAYARQTAVVSTLGESVQIRLGNNGWIEYAVPGAFEIAKTVPPVDGLSPDPEDEFEFTVALTAPGGEAALAGQFPYFVYNTSDNSLVEDAGGYVGDGETITLRGGQYARVISLPEGSSYLVTEEEPSAWYTTAVPEDPDGTISVPQTTIHRPEWVNTYQILEDDTIATPEVTKVMEPSWLGGPYTFELCPVDAPPLEGGQVDTGCLTQNVSSQGQAVDFGDITFDTPGVYTYLLSEISADVAGVVDSQARFTWEVTVTDNGHGTLTAVPTLTQIAADDGTPTSATVDGPATFTNTWTAGNLNRALRIVKRVQDSSITAAGQLRPPRIPYDFTFSTVPTTTVEPAPLFLGPDGTSVDTVTVQSTADVHNVSSPPLQFTNAHIGDTYYYTADETSASMPGMELSDAVWFFQIVVGSVVEGSSTLINPVVTTCSTTQGAVESNGPWGDCDPATATYGPVGAGPEFINVYEPDSAQAQLAATKNLEGRPWDADVFTFEAVPVGDATLTAVEAGWIELPDPFTATATAAASGSAPNVRFDAITFHRQGEYSFAVTEQAPSPEIPGVAPDPRTVFYTVIVTDEPVDDGTALDGQLEASVSVADGGADGTFTNTFTADTLYTNVIVNKTLTGRDAIAGEFTFTVDVDEATAQKLGWSQTSQSFTNTSDASDGQLVRVAQLPQLEFTQDDLGQTFSYTISEEDSGAGGVAYDDTEFAVSIAPQVDAATGEMWVVTTVDDGSTVTEYDSRTDGVVEIGFQNSYSAGPGAAVIPIEKRIVGRDWRAGDTFTFGLAGLDGAPMPGTAIIQVTPDSTTTSPGVRSAEFGPISFAEPGEYTYQIREISLDVVDTEMFYDTERVVTVTVAVTDDGSGTLQTEVTGADTQYENLYRTPYHFDIYKRLVGRDMAEGEFQIHVAPQSQEAADLTGIPYPDGTDIAMPAAADGELSLIQRVAQPVVTEAVLDTPFCYVYSEVIPDEPPTGISFDTTRFQICATFSEGDDGFIEIHSVVSDADDPDVILSDFTASEGDLPMLFPQIAFQNRYNVWTLTKASDPASGSTVQPGSTVTYTLTATNTGTSTLTGALAVDDLSEVLEYSTLGDLPDGLALDGTDLEWTIPELAPDETATISYTVTIADDAVGVTIRNSVTGGGDVAPPEACPDDDPDCRATEHHTPQWSLSKGSDPASGSTVLPGQTVTYTLTAVNTSEAADLTGAIAEDDLSGVLAYADLGDLPDGLTLEGTTLRWAVPDLGATEQATVSYTVTIADNAAGQTLRNVVTGTGTIPPDECEPCATEHVVPAWTLAKSADPVSGSAVRPGEEVAYTLTATNTGPAPIAGAIATDDLSGVLSAATLGDLPDGLTLDGTALAWVIPTLDVGASASISYTVTVNEDVWGATLRNSVSGTGPVPPAECTTAAPCVTEHPVPLWTLRKTSDPASGSRVNPGGTITYTLTVLNDGPAPVADAIVTDDLGGVLHNADLSGTLPDGLALSGTTLTWQVPALAVGEEASVSYTVRVHAGAYDATLRNAATAGPGGGCDGVCETEHTTTSEPPPLVDTGGAVPWLAGSLGAAMLAVGAMLLYMRRRRVHV